MYKSEGLDVYLVVPVEFVPSISVCLLPVALWYFLSKFDCGHISLTLFAKPLGAVILEPVIIK